MVSVIIPSYNSERTIEKCLDALLNQTYSGEFEIILVDSSDDRTPEIVKNKYPSILFTHLNGRTGRGKARNIGIKKSKGNLLLFVDSDCIVPSNWINELVALHRSKNYAAIGGSVVNGNNTMSVIAWAGYIAEFRDFIPGQKGGEVEHLPTCNIAYKREILEKLGGFSEDCFLPEDHDLNQRLILAGDKIFFNPDIKVKHIHRETFNSFIKHQKYIGIITARMIRKYHLQGYIVAGNVVISIILIPIIAMLKFINTIIVFIKFQGKLLLKHPVSIGVFSMGLIPWGLGFIKGSMMK